MVLDTCPAVLSWLHTCCQFRELGIVLESDVRGECVLGVPAIVGLPAGVLFSLDVNRKRRRALELLSFKNDLSTRTQICSMTT